MCCTAMKFVPWFLTNDQKQRRVNGCLELQEKANEDPPSTSRIITCDESWIYGYDPETKQQLLQWKSPQSPRAKWCSRYGFRQRACSLVFFFCTWRWLFTVNLFLLTLWSTWTFTVTFRDAWEKMCDKKDRNFGATTTSSFIMMCPTHTSLKTTEFVTNNNIVIVPHPPYSPDLGPCDFALFPKLKMKLKGRRLETVSDIRRESQAVLKSIKFLIC
jgi:histone-lysine N-methyltransferase SETMAR